MAKEILFTNGAVQNRDFSLDEKPHKATGILSARILNHFVGNEDVIHNWNNVGMFADTDELTTREDRTQKKYTSDFMQAHLERWGDLARVTIASDDDKQFSAWTQAVIAKAIEQGNIYQEDAEFTACKNCGAVIAIAGAQVAVCSKCGRSDMLYTKEEKGLFTDLPADVDELFRYEQLFNKNNIKQELDAFKQLPDRLLLSRNRASGVSLEVVDMPDKVIDPRLGIGLLAVYHATTKGYSKAALVQSYSTLIRTLPYLNGVIKDSDALGVAEHAFALHSKIEPTLFSHAEMTPELLCLHALRQKADITTAKLPAITQEADDMLRKATVIETLCADAELSFELPEVPLSQYDDALSTGNFVNVLARVNKGLGRSINFVKHGKVPDELEEKEVINALGSVQALRPII